MTNLEDGQVDYKKKKQSSLLNLHLQTEYWLLIGQNRYWAYWSLVPLKASSELSLPTVMVAV